MSLDSTLNDAVTAEQTTLWLHVLVRYWFVKGEFDYRIRIRIHSESRFRFAWQIQ